MTGFLLSVSGFGFFVAGILRFLAAIPKAGADQDLPGGHAATRAPLTSQRGLFRCPDTGSRVAGLGPLVQLNPEATVAGRKTWVLVVSDEDANETIFPVAESVLSIGRATDSRLHLTSEGVSRHHAVLDTSGDFPLLIDMGSTNGTSVGGRKIAGACILKSGDTFQLGLAKVRLVCIDGEAPPTAGLPRINLHETHESNASASIRNIEEPMQGGGGIREPGTVTPWYRRSKTLVISAGTVAAALISVFALWDRIVDPPGVDVATIESVNVTKRIALTAFATDGLGTTLTLNAVPDAANQKFPMETELLAQVQGYASAWTLPPRTPTQPNTPTTSTPTKSASLPGRSATRLATIPGDTTSATVTPTPNLSSTPTRSAAPTKGRIPGFPSEEYRAEVQRQLVLDDVRPELSAPISYITNSAIIDANGQPIPPAQVAVELKQALEEVVTDDNSNPTGWTVAVDIDLEGLANVPFLLTWSLDGVDVSETWRAENLAYRITASTQHDSGVAEIWVPDLASTGVYNVNVRLTYELNKSTAAVGQVQLPN